MIDTQFIDSLSRILASANDITHSEISRMAEILEVTPPDKSLNRHKRIHNIMCDLLNSSQNPYKFKEVVEYIANPIRFTDNIHKWQNLQYHLNIALTLRGFELSDQGKIVHTTASKSLSEARQRFENLESRLNELNIHPQVMKYCKIELLQENYFHAISEASKGIFYRIRQMTGSTLDSGKLVDECFKKNNPVIVIDKNKLQTDEEVSAYQGLKHLLSSIAQLYRNTKAHNLKLYNPNDINDAITALTIMSLAHNLLDNCSNTRRLD